jgi:hypothetical protein
MSVDTCFVCKYRHEEGGNMFCRRYPPMAFVMPGGQLGSSNPPINRAGYCGEFVKQMVQVLGPMTSVPLK